MSKCQYYHTQSEELYLYYGFLSSALPIEDMENKIDKWGRSDWWENLERTDLTKEEFNELYQISFYDQILNTVGRGYSCIPCLQKEEELLNKYYPQN